MWGRLPESADGLERAAADYYGSSLHLPLAGSQAGIQVLPGLRAPCRVGIPAVGYQEHAHAWRCAGHEVVSLPDGDPTPWLIEGPGGLDCLVVINPNNPTGQRWHAERLLAWHAHLAARGGWLVVDEAFMDPTPERSLLAHVGRPGLVVLRSLGKFFGLAGARVGFLFADERLLAAAAHRLGPWTLSGPSRWAASRALADRAWQRAAIDDLRAASDRLACLLGERGLQPAGGTWLFQWMRTPDAQRIHEALARRAVLTRRFSEPDSLRFGLPGTEAEWERLAWALEAVDGGSSGPSRRASPAFWPR